MKTIDLTPTWSQVLPWMLAVLEDPNVSEKAKAPLRAEILRLGETMDEMMMKTMKKEEPRG